MLENHAGSDKIMTALTEAAQTLDAVGLNLRLRGDESPRPEMIRFLGRLRDGLHAAHRELWVTMDASMDAQPLLSRAVDGVLMPSAPRGRDIELLEAASPRRNIHPSLETVSTL